jgi:NAD(P)-dependent dehydrogenase (short-subunit alcohol dehydrogenase family)
VADPSDARDARTVALVTGASSGIGEALARLLAAAGHTVVLAARGAQRLERVAAEIAAAGGRAEAEPCDVSDRFEAERLVRHTVERFGRLDVVVANAGAYARKPAEELAPVDIEAAFAGNFWSAFHTARAALPHLRTSRGHLVLMNSVDALRTLPHDGAYAAAKAALAAYGEALRQGLHGSGVHVCTVFPGRVDTPMVEGLDVPKISAKIPPERVARAVMRALRRRSPEVIVPWHCRLLVWADVLSPRLGDWFVRVLRLDGSERRT